jgi:hypothetical protein
MLDIKFIRENKEIVQVGAKKKYVEVVKKSKFQIYNNYYFPFSLFSLYDSSHSPVKLRL